MKTTSEEGDLEVLSRLLLLWQSLVDLALYQWFSRISSFLSSAGRGRDLTKTWNSSLVCLYVKAHISSLRVDIDQMKTLPGLKDLLGLVLDKLQLHRRLHYRASLNVSVNLGIEPSLVALWHLHWELVFFLRSQCDQPSQKLPPLPKILSLAVHHFSCMLNSVLRCYDTYFNMGARDLNFALLPLPSDYGSNQDSWIMCKDVLKRYDHLLVELQIAFQWNKDIYYWRLSDL